MFDIYTRYLSFIAGKLISEAEGDTNAEQDFRERARELYTALTPGERVTCDRMAKGIFGRFLTCSQGV